LDRNLFLLEYKNVSQKPQLLEERTTSKESVQKWLIHSINDPIAKILAKNSNLTKIQLETLLIDFLATNIVAKTLKNEEKARLRLSKAEISRGAFNRTLRQARKNVIQSMYTIILLGYLGMFNNTRLDPYLEAASKLQHYVSAYRDILSNGKLAEEQLRIVSMLREELESSLERLSGTSALSEA
jgi:hypothetical protein